jgi:thioredoxin reductase (NADPH)
MPCIWPFQEVCIPFIYLEGCFFYGDIRLHDVVIVGAGPAGLTAAMYCARGGRKTLVLGNIYSSQQSMGGLYENYPGFPDGIQGIELSERMLSQAVKFGAENQTEMVEKIVPLGDFFRLKTENWQYEAKAVILAMGASHRAIGVPGEKELTGRGVSYCVHCDGALFRDKAVAVIGYGNGAARAVLYLANIASKVHLLSSREKLVAESVYLERIKKLSNFTATNGAEISEIAGDQFVSGVEFKVGNTPRSLKVDGVFVEMGMKPNTDLATALGLEMTPQGYVKVNRLNQETSMPGVFAAGDLTGGRLQVATAVGTGASAAISALQHLG